MAPPLLFKAPPHSCSQKEEEGGSQRKAQNSPAAGEGKMGCGRSGRRGGRTGAPGGGKVWHVALQALKGETGRGLVRV